MTASTLKNLVTEAVSLDREIHEKNDRLKKLKADLVAEAQRRDAQLAPIDGGGTRWIAEGSDGCVACVNFPAPTLKGKIAGKGKTIEKIKKIAASAFMADT